jgi:hypothetical protein
VILPDGAVAKKPEETIVRTYQGMRSILRKRLGSNAVRKNMVDLRGLELDDGERRQSRNMMRNAEETKPVHAPRSPRKACEGWSASKDKCGKMGCEENKMI